MSDKPKKKELTDEFKELVEAVVRVNDKCHDAHQTLIDAAVKYVSAYLSN